MLNWLDDRTGYRQLLHEALYERIPGGSRWRYVWGSTLVFAFFVQLVTGVVLWMHYSPSTQTAWESVYYIEFQMTGGWLLRGIHHFMAQAMIVLMALHLMQVVIDGAYRAPREINFLLGLALMLLVFGMGLTGYLLPWDQKGYWATQVATKILGITPLVGDQLKTLVVGGSEYGHQTLTRFFALHAGVLPGALIGLLVLHLAMFRKYGVTAKQPLRGPDAHFWPDQVLKDAVASLAVLVAVCLLSVYLRAELGAPADPAVAYNAARPEWYYLFLFQFLKLFHGETGELFGAIIIPGFVFALMCAMPFVGNWKLGHRFNVCFLIVLMVGAAGLKGAALYEDFNGNTEKSQEHIAAVALAHAEADVAHELAAEGIPPAGALKLVRNSSQVGGYRLFKQHCATCHSHFDVAGEDNHPLRTIRPDNPTAANLYGFGGRRWVAGILDATALATEHFFANTILADGDMIGWVRDNINDPMSEMDEAEKAAFQKQLEAVIVTLSAEAQLASDDVDTSQVSEGRRLMIDEFGCTDCHRFGSHDLEAEGDLGSAPDLTGYGSREWLIDFIANPQTERFYYSPDNYDDAGRLMPAFAPHADDPSLNRLTREEIELIVDWLRQ